MQRRTALFSGAGTLLWPRAWARGAPAGELRTLKIPSRMAQVVPGGPSGLLGVGVDGSLLALSLNDSPPQRLADGLSPDTPVALGHQRIAARRRDGSLWIQEAGRVGGSDGVTLAPAAGLLVLPLAVIGIEVEGQQHRVVRLEPDAQGTWRRAARSERDVLPDARPLQADLDGSGDGGHVVVLAGPDAKRYPHGVLGDAVEATRIELLERHSLAVLRELVIPAPYVLEDIAPRRVALGARDGLLSVQSGPEGGQLVLIEADPASRAALRVAASGAAIGMANRWMSPTANDTHWLSVHTPHIGGVLHAYRRDGPRLTSERILSGVSNHAIGSRQLDLCAWRGSQLLMPDQSRRRLRLLDGDAGWKLIREWQLPAPVAATLSLSWSTPWAALLEDGRVLALREPG